VFQPYALPQIVKAIVSNQVARFAPALYLKLTGQTGRGDGAKESADDIAAYFRRCILDYLDIFDKRGATPEEYLRDKVILEYGPGDLPGVAMLFVALGVSKVYCVDRFPLVRISAKNLRVVEGLAASLSAAERRRFDACFLDPANPAAGLNPQRIEYLVRPNGLSGLRHEVDLALSRAVLEHVNDLDATFADMQAALRPGALAVHQVDLRSHGLHVTNPLDFLLPPSWLWQLMHSHKGVPNRWRAERYAEIMHQLGVDLLAFKPTRLYPESEVQSILPRLRDRQPGMDAAKLCWEGFWLAFRTLAEDVRK
jgi:SAM-dependent methyltransferase